MVHGFVEAEKGVVLKVASSTIWDAKGGEPVHALESVIVVQLRRFRLRAHLTGRTSFKVDVLL
jgi:hypothetical protein